jgi:hypothetical protein
MKARKSKIGLSLMLVMFLFMFISYNCDSKENPIEEDPIEGSIPLVYDVENTGAEFPKPVFLSFNDLPVIESLPDPFAWADGSGRSTNFRDWEHRRNEIKAMIEHYEIGEKPNRPENITATFANNRLTVNITVNGQTLTLTSNVVLPDGDGPFPAIIGMGGGTGSVPANVFTSRNIAQIPFSYGQIMASAQNRGSEPINKLYPDLTYMGTYAGWSWGVSRLIDGIELALSDKIDLKHLAVTGCSFAGKMALFAGAFDERIALTIAQESGGGGYPAWRVSQTLGTVENIASTDYHWFIDDMRLFSDNAVSKLPHDHHELVAMVAPRALLVTGNSDMLWLADPAGYVSSKAAQKVYETFGIADRFGFSIIGGHEHCQVPASQIPEIEAFVDKFLLGKENVDTNISTNPYPDIDYNRWFQWWGTGNSDMPKPDPSTFKWIFLEAECSIIGAKWTIVNSDVAMGGQYVAAPETQERNLQTAPTDPDNYMVYNFTAPTEGSYALYGLLQCDTADDDSYFLKMDSGKWETINGFWTGQGVWDWKRLTNYTLTAGAHTLTIANRENGANLDRICFTDSEYAPEGKGGASENCEGSVITLNKK